MNSLDRDDQAFIASEYLTSGVDVLLGGGDQYFAPAARKDKRDLYGEFEKAGYSVTKDRTALMSTKSNKILGIFSRGQIPFTIDTENDPALKAATPTLAEMAKVAIDTLKGSSNGFLLQIEGARIDHAAHTNDLGALVFDQMAFEDAVKVAVEFALQDGETLVVITSDHGNANPGLNGYGEEYIDSTAGLESVMKMKASYEVMSKLVGKDYAKYPEVIADRLGISLKPEEIAALASINEGKSPYATSIFLNNKTAGLGVILGNYTKVTWTSTNHTSDYVLVTAIGPGREQFAGLTQNVDYNKWILAHKGIVHENPTMTFEEAKKFMKKSAEASLPHWEA